MVVDQSLDGCDCFGCSFQRLTIPLKNLACADQDIEMSASGRHWANGGILRIGDADNGNVCRGRRG
ncbi:hypothetical protein CLG96_17095 [Sphingomonas oleivorans]|uniref:Uncharacterized protein n=1 Tax=Sphingomonas oleivorans TaxID=1735121 RepID=A0A2T5FU91_9SPHN|nr:hypothetical protein CLG96_17095 [Sphingomonas oleivorans]